MEGGREGGRKGGREGGREGEGGRGEERRGKDEGNEIELCFSRGVS